MWWSSSPRRMTLTSGRSRACGGCCRRRSPGIAGSWEVSMSESDRDDRPGRKERIRQAVDYGMTHDLSDRHVEVDLEPVHASQEVMVGRGLRLPVELDTEIRRI